MRIESYRYEDTVEPAQWVFDEITFRKTNLIVGKSGCGKTRLLMTIFNLGSMIASENRSVTNGHWELIYKNDDLRFKYELQIKGSRVERERLWRLDDSDGSELIDRTSESLHYQGMKLPQLALERPAIALLKEEESMQSAFNAFRLICRRRFDFDGLATARAFGNIPQNLLTQFEKSGLKLMDVYDLALSCRLYLVEKLDKPLYTQIKNMFLDVFPEFTAWQVRKLKASEAPTEIDGVMPGLFLNEKNVSGQIPLTGLSSGMQKVLLIITDVLSAPKGTVYLIDEYENSLGVNAIDFLPDLLALNTDVQAIITTHHPYLINAMPIENWQILSRKGSHVTTTRGDERKEIYEASAQEAFTMLLNDPLYSD